MDGTNCGKNGLKWCHRHHGKNGWSGLWQKWVKLTVAKMGGAHCGKNGWNSPWQKWVEMVIKRLWQKWVKLTLAKMGGVGD